MGCSTALKTTFPVLSEPLLHVTSKPALKADLHLHTYYSDGTDSPAAVIDRAAKLHFDIIAITDHDTIAGIPEALEEGKRCGVRVIPGVEITSQFHNHELHMLAYFSPDSAEGRGWRCPELVEQLARDTPRRENRAQKIVERLNALGIAMTMEEVRKQACTANTGPKKGTLGRPHIAAAMVAGHHVASFDQAFEEYLKRGGLPG